MYVVITGASRGIGLELVKKALSSGCSVLAVARHPEASEELKDLANNNQKLKLVKGDLHSAQVIDNMLAAVTEWPSVDVLINNAGIFKDDETIEDYSESFLINSIMPLFITRAFLPLLKKSKHPRSIQITSQMGSIKDNSSGGSYSYRASKSALNMFFKSLSVDEPWLTSILIHPGWVKTRMGGENAPITTHESVNGIWSIINKCQPQQNGSFLNYRGESLPW